MYGNISRFRGAGGVTRFKRLIAVSLCCFGAVGAQAAPRVIEQSAQLAAPAPGARLGLPAISGNRIVAVYKPEGAEATNVYLYTRNTAGQWSLPAVLFQAPAANDLAIRGNVVALTTDNALHIAEFTASGLVRATLPKPAAMMYIHEVEIGSDSIIAVKGASASHGQQFTNALVYRKNASGVWGYEASLPGGALGIQEYDDIDVSGETVVISKDAEGGGSARVFERSNGAWMQTAELRYPLSDPAPRKFGGKASLDGDTIVIGTAPHPGEAAIFLPTPPELYVFTRTGGAWNYAGLGTPIDREFEETNLWNSPQISGDLVVQHFEDDDRYATDTLLVYQREANGLRPVAELAPRERVWNTFYDFDLSGRTVVTTWEEGLLVFNIPTNLTQPAPVQDNFQDGNANGWAPSNASAWTVAQSGTTRVYRQNSLAGENRSVLSAVNWTSQSLEADVIPRATEGADRWAGLAVRMTDINNYYYLALRNSNQVQLRKKVNGSYVTLGAASTPFQLNRLYRLRVEAIGARIRAYVNGQLVVDAVDRTHTSGRPALMTFSTRADFDNVAITPNPLVTIFEDAFWGNQPSAWTKLSGGWIDPPARWDWEEPDPTPELRLFRQTATSGAARAVAGVSTDDQTVQASLTIDSLGANGWLGVMARYRDPGNFYYLRVGGGAVSIRKFVNGVSTELSRTPLATTNGLTYSVRLEAVGSYLRGYVNGRYMVGAVDASHAAGRYGLATFNTAARFDDVIVRQP